MGFFRSKKGQITIFVILAIVIIAGVVIYFVVRDDLTSLDVPKQLEPVYIAFENCIIQETQQASKILGFHGGYLELPDFEPGSDYRPFSNMLDFSGQAIPYWFYVSNNNILKEQVPSVRDMEIQLEDYLVQRLKRCDFSQLRNQGFYIKFNDDTLDVDVSIKDDEIDVIVDIEIYSEFDVDSATKKIHEAKVSSSLGRLYDISKNIYNQQVSKNFLETYSSDVLRLYAPVDGVEISCSPKVDNVAEIDKTLRQALEGNIQAIKVKGTDYIVDKEHEYFVQDLDIDNKLRGEQINFFYDKNWPYRLEVWPAEGNLLITEPVGLQEGLGVLGFCYVNYHYIYDLNFPVLIQVYNNEELFQFPVAVLIEKNKFFDEAELGNYEEYVEEMCDKANTDLEIYTYDSGLNPLEARISFNCLNERCFLGETDLQVDSGYLNKKVPQCVNAVIKAEAEGHTSSSEIVSTINDGKISLVLDKQYELEIDLNSDNFAIINFESDKLKRTILWPEQKKVMLSQGFYNISTRIFSESSLVFPETTKHECIEVSREGLLGVFGATKEKCFDITLPSQTITNVLSGGGKSFYFFNEADLKKSKTIKINAEKFAIPSSLEQIQGLYETFETKYINVDLI